MEEYRAIRIYTSERAKFEGKPLSSAVVSYVKSLRINARATVFRGTEGCYENGAAASGNVLDLSYDMPLVIDVLLPAAEASAVLERLADMVSDGIVGVLPVTIASRRSPDGILPAHLLVRDVMTVKPLTVHPDFTARSVLELLLDRGLKALPVVDDEGRLAGIITQCDLVQRSGLPARLGILHTVARDRLDAWRAEAEAIRASDIMTTKVRSIREDHSVREAVHLMVQSKLKRLPVLDSGGRLVGVLSRIDILKALSSRSESPKPSSEVDGIPAHPALVRDVLARDALALPQDMKVGQAVDRMLKAGDQRAAVVDGQGRLVGLITDERLLKAVDRVDTGPALFRRWRARADAVSNWMVKDVVRVTEDTTIVEAVRLMTERGFKRIPVVDGDGRFCGMIRRDSVLIALSRHI